MPLPAPHTPILPTEEFRGASKTNPYGDFVLQVDATVGALMRAVEESGVADNTIFIVTADNGCSPRAKFDELKEFGHHPSGPFRGHKADIFEGGHRVPFVVRWPDRVKPNTRSDQTICLTDLMRTCADALDVELAADAGVDSVSFLPAMTGTATQPLREATVHHSINGSFAIRQGKWKLVLCPGSGGWSAPKPAAAKKQGLPSMQLFDLDADIGEQDNLAAEHPERVRRLVALLGKYVADGRSTPGPKQTNEGEIEFLPASDRKPVKKTGVVYKTAGTAELKLHVYRPRKQKGVLPAVVFFFGGGWNGGTPEQFFPQCEHLAAKGMVAISAEYRVKSRHQATPFDCVADARSAIRYVRANAKQLRVDPNRIVAGGGSAGGHLAAATATLEVPADEHQAEAKTSSRPNALVLFNPVFDNGPGGWGHARVKDRYQEISPIHNLDRADLPPTTVFLGTQDKLVPVATAERYRELMQKGGHRCDLNLYEGQGHGFFNHRKGKDHYFRLTMTKTEEFLVDLGFLRQN